MIHHCPGHSLTMSHQGTWLVSWKTCLLTPLPGFQERVLKSKHLGVAREKRKKTWLDWLPELLCPSSPMGSSLSYTSAPLHPHVKLNPISEFVPFQFRSRARHGFSGEVAKKEEMVKGMFNC